MQISRPLDGLRPVPVSFRPFESDTRHQEDRCPDRGQFPGTPQPRQHFGIAAICLDPVSGLARDHCRRNDATVEPELCQVAIQTVAAWPGLVAKMGSAARSRKAAGQANHRISGIRDSPEEPQFPSAASYSIRMRGRVVDIEMIKLLMSELRRRVNPLLVHVF